MIFNTLKLLLPALIPSWNFFDVIAPSPRIEYALFDTEDQSQLEWHAFRPRPMQLSFIQMLKRMLWNPQWNETLFMMSCAERIMENPTQPQHSENEILNRILKELISNASNVKQITATHLQFRLLVIQRHDSQLITNIIFQSRTEFLHPLSLQPGDPA